MARKFTPASHPHFETNATAKLQFNKQIIHDNFGIATQNVGVPRNAEVHLIQFPNGDKSFIYFGMLTMDCTAYDLGRESGIEENEYFKAHAISNLFQLGFVMTFEDGEKWHGKITSTGNIAGVDPSQIRYGFRFDHGVHSH